MSEDLQFEHTIPFYQDAPAFFLHLIGPTGRLEVLVTLDTGSQYSLFSGGHAQDIGIDLLEGKEIALSSLGGAVKGYLHQVVLEISGCKFKRGGCIQPESHPPRATGAAHALRANDMGSAGIPP